MAHIAIVCKSKREELIRVVPELIAWLRQRGYEPLLDRNGCEYAPPDVLAVNRAELPVWKPLLVIVLGGDGTLLSVARAFAATGTPLLCVNLGFLGFLTEVRLADLYTTLEGWLNNSCELDARAMLQAELWRDGAMIATYEALNDVVISKADMTRLGYFAVELNHRNVARFRADGVIVSTPTGSTAYTLAANGPILTPDVDALVVTPICPHLLTLRPIVVRGDAALTVRVEDVQRKSLLVVDGQFSIELSLGDEIHCHRSRNTVNLVRMSESGFFEALRSKLSWGEQ
jgi:NAD+ kinase